MKKVMCMIAVLALVCFASMAFAGDAANALSAAAAKADASVKGQAVKAVSGEMVVGKIKNIDTAANKIVIKDQTINVKPDQIADLKVGDKVKVTLVSGTMDAEKIVPYSKKAAKAKTKKETKQAKEQAVQKAADKAVEKVSQ